MKKRLEFDKLDGWHEVYNKDEEYLGLIEYDEIWKCWIWEQQPEIKMDKGCLKEVVDYIDLLEKKDG